MAFRNEDKIRSFSDNEKLREFSTNGTSPEENRTDIVQAKGK